MDTVRADRLKALYSDRWMSRLRGFVARRYHDFSDWEGWFEEAHQNLALKIDQLPAEREITDALVFAVFKNELVSVKRNRLGYPRPRLWLRQFSELGQDLFEWMCLQGLSREKILQRADARAKDAAYDAAASGSDGASETGNAGFPQLIEKLVHMMIEKKECDGVRPQGDRVDDDAVESLVAETSDTQAESEQEQLRLVLSMILTPDQLTDDVQSRASQSLAAMRDALAETRLLSDLDILVLRCYYFQGLSQNDVAKLVGQPLQKVVRRREAAIRRIREFMEAHGFDRQALL